MLSSSCCYSFFWSLSILRPLAKCLLRSLAGMYVSNDIVGLYRVKLKTSTRLHLYKYCVFNHVLDDRFSREQSCKIIISLHVCVCNNVSVNAYLGLRLCYDKESQADLCGTAYYTYAIVCFLNWILHLWFFDISCLGYYILILFIVYDDIILLKWLHKEHTSNH